MTQNPDFICTLYSTVQRTSCIRLVNVYNKYSTVLVQDLYCTCTVHLYLYDILYSTVVDVLVQVPVQYKYSKKPQIEINSVYFTKQRILFLVTFCYF